MAVALKTPGKAAAPPSDAAVTALDLQNLLLRRHGHPEWALQLEVILRSRQHGERRADAIAMNLFPSRGLTIHGFEIKCSRRDWLAELKQPNKAEVFAESCDHWWLVAPRKIVREGELPEGWGHLAPTSDLKALEVVVPAAKRAGGVVPDRRFLAAMLQQASRTMEHAVSSQVEPRVAIAVKAARESVEKHVRTEFERQTSEGRAAIAALNRVKEETGVDLAIWNADAVMATALRLAALLHDGRAIAPFTALQRQLTSAQKLLNDVHHLMGRELPALGSELPAPAPAITTLPSGASSTEIH